MNLRLGLILWMLCLESGSLAAGRSCFFNNQAENSAGLSSRQVVIFEAQDTRTQLHAFAFEFRSKACPFKLSLKSAKRATFPVSLRDHAGYPEQLRKLLVPVMQFAKLNMPSKERGRTLALFRFDVSTVQTLSDKQRRHIAHVVSELMRRSGFLVPSSDADATGPMFSADLAVFRWVAVNFLIGTFDLKTWGTSCAVLSIGKEYGFTDTTNLVHMLEKNNEAKSTVTYTWPCGRRYALNVMHDPGLAEARLGILGYFNRIDNHHTIVSPCVSPNFTGIINSTLVKGTPHSIVAGPNRSRLCSAAVIDWLQGRTPRHNKVASPENVIAVGGYYHAFRPLLSMYFPGRSLPGEVKVWELVRAAKYICYQTEKISMRNPNVCMDTIYMSVLLRHFYGFDDSLQMRVVDVLANDIAVSGVLGFAIEQAMCSELSGESRRANSSSLSDCALALSLPSLLAIIFCGLLILSTTLYL